MADAWWSGNVDEESGVLHLLNPVEWPRTTKRLQNPGSRPEGHLHYPLAMQTAALVAFHVHPGQ